MQDKDQKLIWESYIKESEYGPSGAPSIDVSEWKLYDWYKEHEWEDETARNPWTKYAHQVLQDLEQRVLDGDGEEGRTYIAFFGAPEGSSDYETWTDPGIVVAFNNSQEKYHGGIDFSKAIFVDNDGESDPHVLSDQQADLLVQTNETEIRKRFEDDEEHQTWDPYGPEGVVSRSDFY